MLASNLPKSPFFPTRYVPVSTSFHITCSVSQLQSVAKAVNGSGGEDAGRSGSQKKLRCSLSQTSPFFSAHQLLFFSAPHCHRPAPHGQIDVGEMRRRL
ncbi:hypothetical protein ACFX14_013356 [Malus domestica]